MQPNKGSQIVGQMCLTASKVSKIVCVYKLTKLRRKTKVPWGEMCRLIGAVSVCELSLAAQARHVMLSVDRVPDV